MSSDYTTLHQNAPIFACAPARNPNPTPTRTFKVFDFDVHFDVQGRARDPGSTQQFQGWLDWTDIPLNALPGLSPKMKKELQQIAYGVGFVEVPSEGTFGEKP